MRRLPQLATGSVQWALPMADRSAAVLAEALLADDVSQSACLLAAQLADDPPLVLWAVLVAGQRDQLHPQSLGQVARWFAERALAVLQWDQAGDGPFDASGESRAEAYADLVARRLELADAAALVAASDGQPAAERAYLAGLVFQPEQWLAIATGGEASKSVSGDWPGSLHDLLTAAGDRVAEAADLLSGKQPEPSADFDAEACRRRAMEGRRAWLATEGGLVKRLPALAARLARLEQLERRFQQALETEKLAAMAELAAGAGHEINNPLAIIGGRAQLFLEEETDPERRRELALMNAQVRRAHEMIADMRLFARPPKPEPETVDLVELVDAVVAELTPQLAGRAVSLGRTGENEPMEIEADPAQLEVALRAICRNSMEAIGHGGRIEIALRRSGGDVEIRISDDGPGIPPEHRRHLFDPFYSARQAGRGLGLGLSKCWRIVTGHGGRIEVDSRPGHGAAFTITLPRRFSPPQS